MSVPHMQSEKQLPIYVINLASRSDRWRLQQLQARLHGISINRFSAIDGIAGKGRFPQSTLTEGATGMWASFDTLVTTLAAEGIEAAVVLEDDAILAPRFHSKARAVRDSSPDTVALVQLGFLTESSWRPQNSLLQNIRRILRPKSRLRAAINRTKRGMPPKETHMKAGMHAVLIFPERLAPILRASLPDRPGTLPLDNALVTASEAMPEVLTRVRRSMAFQLPIRSDIAWGRH